MVATAAEQLSTVLGVWRSVVSVPAAEVAERHGLTESPNPNRVSRPCQMSTHSQSASPERRMPVGLAPQLSSMTLLSESHSFSWHREMRVLSLASSLELSRLWRVATASSSARSIRRDPELEGGSAIAEGKADGERAPRS